MYQQSTWLLLGVLCLGFLPACTPVQEANWQMLLVKANQASDQGLYGEAEELYLAALKEAERFGEEDIRLELPMRNKKRVQRGREWKNVGYWKDLGQALQAYSRCLARAKLPITFLTSFSRLSML